MSIDHMFYNVEPALRLAIVKHEIKPEHIWKLDSQAKEQAKTKSYEIEENAQSSGVQSAVQVIFATGEYMRKLENITYKHDWDATLRYHFEFHSIRLAEMRMGDYSGWAVFNCNLGGQYLDGHLKPSTAAKSTSTSCNSQTCFAFQSGKCASPCAQG
ncbi:hypothetical protein M422DRAFT_259552 [Sphaerobolus stellatus SS14]|uniref:Uncharacterized protein n=1 Tax=Sphaerobolus stellatus (strain SS14) TaxID=990650 RepID=A0A0C9VJU8_SPHS4|nr:hypothetical protein M422DRAFT_259552 [Sphaerobolus stellatus SS14]